MDKKETKQKVTELLDSGKTKTEVFQMLSGGEVKDRQLAFFIAAHPNQYLYEKHYKKINVLITIMFIQAFLGGVFGFVVGAKLGATAMWSFAAIIAFFPLWFAYGFYRNYAGIYNAYAALTLIQLPKMLEGVTQSATSMIGMVIGLSIFAYVLYVKSLLFPDLGLFTPTKKVNGQYVFSD